MINRLALGSDCDLIVSRASSCSDQTSGAQSVVPQQRRLFPVGHSRALLRLDRRVLKRDREGEGEHHTWII